MRLARWAGEDQRAGRGGPRRAADLGPGPRRRAL